MRPIILTKHGFDRLGNHSKQTQDCPTENREITMATRKMTVSQAIVEFLAHQYTVDGDYRERTVQGIFGIFGHGNVAGIGQALKQFSIDDPSLENCLRA